MTLSLLSALWTLSLALGSVSASVMFLVIGRRALSSMGSFTANELRDAVLQALMTDWNLVEPSVVRRLMLRRRQLASLVIEFATLVRGPEFELGIARLADKGAAEQLVHLFNRGNREDQLAACEALCHFKSEATASQLIHVARRARSSRLRIAALRAFTQMGNQLPLDDAIRYMRLTDRQIPAEATAVLLASVHQNPEPALRRISSGMDSVAIRAALVWAMGEGGLYEAIPVIEQLMVHNDARIRVAAIHAIGELGFCSDRTMLLYCLADGNSDIRAEAAAVIGKLGDGSAAAHLAILLSDPDWDVRFRAANALFDIGAPGIAELKASASPENAGSRRARAAALVLSERRAA